ncbi:hypothetical protein SAMN04487967_2328 [Natronorubrum sediminis]|uniref:Uncharacterized protein n=1 Tax=Natronorubrum sediminis TaxID=640943 RepID=A0A1H6FYS9_9EURY|nr:hypothetical protein SAMN04487967_2328 [Natronorubrum sediminis]
MITAVPDTEMWLTSAKRVADCTPQNCLCICKLYGGAYLADE